MVVSRKYESAAAWEIAGATRLFILHHGENGNFGQPVSGPNLQRDAAMQLTGIHHLTAISAHAKGNLAFYTGVLGMRLVKKTVNQDDVSAYHLFYADGKANPGTDLTSSTGPRHGSIAVPAVSRAPACG
jgi:glyoxalase family protein